MPPTTTVGGLVNAAANLDVDAVDAAARASIASYGVLRSWEWLISPAWHALRAGLAETEIAERLFTRAVSQILVESRRPLDRLPISTLMACTAREDHVLPLEALAAALAAIGAGSCVLGARVPSSAVMAAADRLRPAVVVVWSQTGATADHRRIPALSAACPAVEVITAGPGWDDVAVPASTVTAALQLTLLRLSSPGLGEETRNGAATAGPPRRLPHARGVRSTTR